MLTYDGCWYPAPPIPEPIDTITICGGCQKPIKWFYPYAADGGMTWFPFCHNKDCCFGPTVIGSLSEG